MARHYKKKGQTSPSGGAAAIVIGVITVLILFYIVFLPPEERAALLDDEDTADGLSGTRNITLYENDIGTLAYSGQRYFEHTLTSIYLSESTDTQVLQEFNTFTIRNGWFSKQGKQLSFQLADLRNTGAVRLSFDAPIRGGTLRVSLNGQIIFEEELQTSAISPIELPEALLSVRNTLTLDVSGVGPAFWRTNTYELTNAKILADVTDRTRQEGSNIFVTTQDEIANLENSYLQFDAVCELDEVGPLTIDLNNRQIYQGVPECNSINRIDLNLEDISEKLNTFTYSTSQGNYRLERIRLRNYQKEIKQFIDYFTIDEDDAERLERRDAYLIINFVDDGEDKVAQLTVNGRYFFIDTDEDEYKVKVTDALKEGNNYLSIDPRATLNIVDLEVYLE